MGSQLGWAGVEEASPLPVSEMTRELYMVKSQPSTLTSGLCERQWDLLSVAVHSLLPPRFFFP